MSKKRACTNWNDKFNICMGESKTSPEMQDLVDAATYAEAWEVPWTAIEQRMTVVHPDGTTITTTRRIER